MVLHGSDQHRWGVILAGGEGTRLRPLTRLLYGDDRPKQFCQLWGDRTLLGRTRNRIERDIARKRTVFALTHTHEPFYGAELADVPPQRMVIQPCNRGTLPATLWCLLRIARLDPEAVVTFFPSDHYYSDERGFMAGVKSACGIIESGFPFIVLLGAPATHAETAFGWIQPDDVSFGPRTVRLSRVTRFWEKPSADVAERLLACSCAWNTFVMAGRVGAFLAMIASVTPDLYQQFSAIEREPEQDRIDALYQSIPVADLSAQVLSASTDRLAVLFLEDVGWSDLGDPQRAIETLSRNGLQHQITMPLLRPAASELVATRKQAAQCA